MRTSGERVSAINATTRFIECKGRKLARDFLASMTILRSTLLLAIFPLVAAAGTVPAGFPPAPAKVLSLDEATITAQKSAWIDEALAAIR